MNEVNAFPEMNSFIPPKLIGHFYNDRSLTITYLRYGTQYNLLLMPEDLAKDLKELTAIEGYDAEGEQVMVLHTVERPVVGTGGLYMAREWDGEPLTHWMQREFTDTIAQAIANLHEHKKDTAMMRSHLTQTLHFIAKSIGGTK